MLNIRHEMHFFIMPSNVVLAVFFSEIVQAAPKIPYIATRTLIKISLFFCSKKWPFPYVRTRIKADKKGMIHH